MTNLNLETNNFEYSQVLDTFNQSRIIKPENQSPFLLDLTQKATDTLLNINASKLSQEQSEKEKYLDFIDFDFYSNKEKFNNIYEDKYTYLKNKYTQINAQSNLKQSFSNVNLVNKINSLSPTVGGLSKIEKMVELTYTEDPKFKYDMAEQIGYIKQLSSFWKKIAGDGNCFYRSVVFLWMENIIFTNKPIELMYIIERMDKCFQSTYENTKSLPLLIKELITQIDKPLVINILIYIIELMINNKLEEAYDSLLKAFNFSSTFDLAIIMYMRYEIYEYILINQNKLFSVEFPVLLGNLLPSEYETDDGKFLFMKYFENDTLKLFTCAEKLSIYVTPFIIKQNIRLLMYDYGVDCNIQTKEFNCYLNNKNTLYLLYRKCHYDSLYCNEYSLKYSIYLSKYQCKDILKVVNQELIDYYKKNEVDMIDIQQSKFFDKRNKQMKKQLNKKDSIEGQIETKPKTEENITEVKEKVSCEIESLQTQRKIIEQEIELLKKKENELNKCKTQSNTKPKKEQKDDQQFNYEPQMKVKFCINCNKQNSNLICSDCVVKYKSYISRFKTKSESSGFTPDSIKYLKKDFCISCCSFISNSKHQVFNLPCGCVICSSQCRKTYFTSLSRHIDYTLSTNGYLESLYCKCGDVLAFTHLRDIILFLVDQSVSSLKLSLINYFFNQFTFRCMFCNTHSNSIKKKAYVMIDDELSKKFFNEKVKHWKCEECEHLPTDIVECCLCGYIHK